MPCRFPVYELANLPTIAPTPSHIIKFILFPLSLKNTDQSYLLSRHVLRITDLGSQKHQRNSDNNVGFRLIRLSVFVLRGGRGDEGCPMIFISAIDLKGQPKPRSSPALTASALFRVQFSFLATLDRRVVRAVSALRAACFKRRTWVRPPLDNRFGLVLLVLSATSISSLSCYL
jgi:hypothetical protein